MNENILSVLDEFDTSDISSLFQIDLSEFNYDVETHALFESDSCNINVSNSSFNHENTTPTINKPLSIQKKTPYYVATNNSSRESIKTKSNSAVRTLKRKPKVNLSRERQKAELVSLRNQLQELENQLKRLKKSQSNYALQLTTSPLHSLWRQVALQQRNAKQRVEFENTLLRRVLNQQWKVAKEIEQMLQNQPFAMEEDLSYLSNKRLRSNPLSDCDVSNVHRMKRLESQMHATNVVLSQFNIKENAGFEVHENRSISGNIDDGFCVRGIQCRKFSFDVHETGDALWQLLTQSPLKVPNGYCAATNSWNGMITTKGQFTVYVNGTPFLSVGESFSRRFIQDDREIIVFEGTRKMTGTSELEIMELGWIVVDRHNDEKNSDKPQTLIKGVIVYNIKQEPGSVNSNTPPGVYSKILMDFCSGNSEYFFQALSDILVKKQSESTK